MNIKTTAFVILLVLTFCGIYAQDLSNKGKDFWIAYAGHYDGTTSRMALYITSDQNASGVVDINGSSIPFTVAANQVTTVQVTNSSTPSNFLAYNGQVEGIGAKKGIHVTADKPVAVYAHILNAARSGSTLVLPTNVLGKEYYIASYKSTTPSNTRRSQFDVVATMDNTTVQITPTQADGNGARQANVPFTITLSKGDVYQYQSDEDLTGTYIKSIGTTGSSCQPIAVFSGSTFTSMGCPSANTGDNLYQQLFPFGSWGKVYYTAPFISRSYDIFRILVQDPAEPVYVNGAALNPSTLLAGRFYEINTQGNNSPRIITSGKPICVLQYLITQGCDGVQSDPEMVIINPVEQTLNDITVMSARNNLTPPNTNINSHYLNIIFKTNSLNSLLIDGAPPTAIPVPITGTGYSYIQQNVTASTAVNPAHRITSDSGFICIAYGYGNVESYGYNAGANVKDLYQFVSVQNQYATVDFPATCKSSPFYFYMTFPYQPTQIKWIFGPSLNAIGLNDTTIINPSYDSTWNTNGKQLYKYKLPKPYRIATTGTFPIKLLAQNPTPDGCSGEQEINYELQVYERPAAGFSFTTNGCVTDPISFTDISVTNGRPSYKWFWNFGDGTFSAAQNPSRLFGSAGSYPVNFAMVTDIGCVSDTATKTVMISEPPLAKFGVSMPTCVGKSLSFTDSSSSATSPIVKWTWDFGDNLAKVTATTGTTQTHTFASAGTYNVTLQVENASGCKSSVFSQSVSVSAKPVVDFTFGNACLPQGTMTFTNRSTIADGTQNQLSYAWKFGDGGSANVKDPTYNYKTAGPFTAKLIVTSAAGCIDSASKAINTIYEQPAASFSAPAEICLDATAGFTSQSTASNSTITAWEWNFGDGTPVSNQENPVHTYTKPGTYPVTLKVTSVIGCVDTSNGKSIMVNPLPTADFSFSSLLCENGTINFSNISTANAGAISKSTWDFGDGTAPSSQTFLSHVYQQSGNYLVSLLVETDKGCKSNVTSKPIVIHPLPEAGFVVPGNCINDPIVTFTDTSSIADGSGAQLQWLWNFGDANALPQGNASTAKDGQHRYTATGNYNVSLNVTSKDGCSSSLTQVFTVNGAVPVSQFTFQNALPLCSNDSLAITDNSTVTPGKLVKLEIYWDYNGDPTNKTTVNNPSQGKIYRHSYPVFFTPATKTYRLKFVIYSGINCLTEKDTSITVLATPDVEFDTVTSICANEPSFQLQAGTTNMTTGTGIFTGKGVSTIGLFNPATAGEGAHVIRYTYTGATGCVNQKEQTINVYPVPRVSAGPDKVILEGGSTLLSGTATGNDLRYEWAPYTLLNNAFVLQPTASPADDVFYKLTVTSANGCIASDEVFVKVLKAPTVPNAFSPNGDGVHDKWDIQYLESYPGATVAVFNRYGQKVFESRGYAKPWDGTLSGKLLPVGTYYYIIDPKNGRKPIAGFVDIIR
jgi:gliding motility-associated-like protein